MSDHNFAFSAPKSKPAELDWDASLWPPTLAFLYNDVDQLWTSSNNAHQHVHQVVPQHQHLLSQSVKQSQHSNAPGHCVSFDLHHQSWIDSNLDPTLFSVSVCKCAKNLCSPTKLLTHNFGLCVECENQRTFFIGADNRVKLYELARQLCTETGKTVGQDQKPRMTASNHKIFFRNHIQNAFILAHGESLLTQWTHPLSSMKLHLCKVRSLKLWIHSFAKSKEQRAIDNGDCKEHLDKETKSQGEARWDKGKGSCCHNCQTSEASSFCSKEEEGKAKGWRKKNKIKGVSCNNKESGVSSNKSNNESNDKSNKGVGVKGNKGVNVKGKEGVDQNKKRKQQPGASTTEQWTTMQCMQKEQ